MKLRPFLFIKRFMPKSLFGRFTIILLIPLILVQIVLSYTFFDRHTDTILRSASNTIAGDMALITHMSENTSLFELQSLASKHLGLTLHLDQGKTLSQIGQAKDTWLYDHMNNALFEHLNHPFYFRISKDTIYVDVETPQGVLKFETPRKRLLSKTTYLVLIWTAASAFLLFIVAILFMRNQIKPIRKLADMAERFGKGQETLPFKPEGATEVRKAGIAFNEMQRRITRFVEERMQQLACVSHDLRTPLARMKLQLALLSKDEGIQNLRDDVDAMIIMIQGFLDFARGASDEPALREDIGAFIKECVTVFSRDHSLSITMDVKEGEKMFIKKQFLNRCLTNLLLNSEMYASEVFLSLHVHSTAIKVIIDDNGPGIVEIDRERVFQPFVRLDPARNAQTGGVGLGMTIVRDAVHHHGGHVSLDTSPMGGLRVTLDLPR